DRDANAFCRRLHGHRDALPEPHGPSKAVLARGSNGQPPRSECSMYSFLKYLIEDTTGLTAPSPNGQNARPSMLSQMSRSSSTSASLPVPRSSESSTWTIQYVPSRHGVHFPHDSCW